MKNKSEKTAIIDLGSNSVRLIIIKIFKKKYYKLIEQEKEMVRLGENLNSKNLLQDEAMERTLSALRLFRDLINSHNAEKIILTATAAVRNADNKEVFLDKIREEFHWEFDVISGEKEAYLGFLGVINTINEKNFFLVDIGGASTEISLIKDRKLQESISLGIGSLRASNGEDHLLKQLNKIPWLNNKNNFPLIGLGGTIRSFAKIYKKNTGYPIEKLHNLEIPVIDAQKTIDIVSKKNKSELHKINGLDKSRVDIIVPGLKILNSLLKVCHPERIIISGNGLREGLFYEHLLRNKKSCIYKDVRKESIKNLIKNYDVNQDHTNHVKYLAGELFKNTASSHHIDGNNKYFLDFASALHDLGIYIDYYSHQRHSAYLIMNSNLNGFNHRELFILSCLAGRHRNKSFRINYPQYRKILKKDDFQLINVLSLLLRIAESLDRREDGKISSILPLGETKQEIILGLVSKGDISLEISAAMKNAIDFEKIIGKKLILEKTEAPSF